MFGGVGGPEGGSCLVYANRINYEEPNASAVPALTKHSNYKYRISIFGNAASHMNGHVIARGFCWHLP